MPRPSYHNTKKICNDSEKLHNYIEDIQKEYIIMFADLKESTEYRRTMDILSSLYKVLYHNNIISDIIEESGGIVVKWLGDGVMAAFEKRNENLQKAIYASMKIQKKFQEYNNQRRSQKINHIETKIGIAMGRCFPYKDKQDGIEDLIGEPVDIAARIQSLARPKQILVHQNVAEKIENTEISLSKLVYKNKVLKGLDPFDIYEILWDKREFSGIIKHPSIFLISLDEVEQIESEAEEVWVYTPTLVLEKKLRKIILENLLDGKPYKYILPNKTEVESALNTLIKFWKRNGADLKKLETYFCREECCVSSTIAVYNPHNGEDSCVIVSLPRSGERRFPIKTAFLLNHEDEVNFYTSLLYGLFKGRCIKDNEEQSY